MPNGYEHERDAVWAKSRFWGAVWQLGDSLYYIGLVGPFLVGFVLLRYALVPWESWETVFKAIAVGAGYLLLSFPLGLVARFGLQGLARRQAGEP